jgi:nitrite reductase/ring-hydroxylating ferredoxin subunit
VTAPTAIFDTERYLKDIDEPTGRARVNSRAFLDEEVFQLEIESIFTRGWVYIAHESQVGAPGDYITTSVGRTSVVLVRDDSSELHLFVNRCLHRGMALCRNEKGNASYLRCPYHGWTYRNNGAVAGVTFPQGYGSESATLRRSKLDEAAELQSFEGFIFAKMEPSSLTLEAHLGRAATYLKKLAHHVPDHEIVIDPVPYRAHYPGNWKLQVENSIDSYHAGVVHQAFFDIVAARTGRDVNENGFMHDDSPIRTVDLGDGHGLMSLANTRSSIGPGGNKGGDSYLGRARTSPDGASLLDSLIADVGVERAAELVEPTDFNLTVFPNLMLVQGQIRVVHPVDLGNSYVDAYVPLLRGAPDAVNELRRRNVERFWGPCGFGTPDDVEMFVRFQQNASPDSPQWLMLSRGVDRQREEDGLSVSRASDEGQIRSFYRRWGAELAAAAPRESS